VTLFLALLLAFCPPEGKPGPGGTLAPSEAAANRLKNRTGVPTSFVPVSIPQMLVASPEEWTQAQGGELTGYVIRTKLAETESCNCWSPKARDIHIYLASGPEVTDSRRQVICEVSPRTPLQGPRPRPGTKVVVRGYFFFDGHHANEPGRGTAWELHPITSITEVR